MTPISSRGRTADKVTTLRNESSNLGKKKRPRNGSGPPTPFCQNQGNFAYRGRGGRTIMEMEGSIPEGNLVEEKTLRSHGLPHILRETNSR